MQFINFLAIFLGFLGLAIAQDAYPTTSIVSSSTETLTRTIRVSQISTVTSLISSTTEAASSSSIIISQKSSIIISQNSTMSTMSPTSTKLGPSASLPAGTGGIIPSITASPPLPTDFKGAASGLSAFGAAGAIAMAVVAML